MSSKTTFTLVSAHFGDRFWVSEMLARVDRFSKPGAVIATSIIDQDRSGALNLPKASEVVEYPRDDEQISIVGHDHPASLNRRFRSTFSTSHVLLLDSDCFPVRSDWLDLVENELLNQDAIVALDPARPGLAHPCFMVIPVAAAEVVDFAQGLREGIDTGRLVGQQLARAGLDVLLDAPSPAFRGRRGHYYLNGAVYHHGSASFLSSGDRRVRGQVNGLVERFFRSKIEKDDFTITRAQAVLIRALGRAH